MAAEATATAGGMPMKKSSGVRMKPPPTPNMPESSPTIVPISEQPEAVDGDFGDGKVDLHRPGPLRASAEPSGWRGLEASAIPG